MHSKSLLELITLFSEEDSEFDRELYENFTALKRAVLGTAIVDPGTINSSNAAPFPILTEVLQASGSLYEQAVYKFIIYGTVDSALAADDFDLDILVAGTTVLGFTRSGPALSLAGYVLEVTIGIAVIGAAGRVRSTAILNIDGETPIVKTTYSLIPVDLSALPAVVVNHKWLNAKAGNKLTVTHVTSQLFNEEE